MHNANDTYSAILYRILRCYTFQDEMIFNISYFITLKLNSKKLYNNIYAYNNGNTV